MAAMSAGRVKTILPPLTMRRCVDVTKDWPEISSNI
jgi:predicted ATPase with chaperone activity